MMIVNTPIRIAVEALVRMDGLGALVTATQIVKNPSRTAVGKPAIGGQPVTLVMMTATAKIPPRPATTRGASTSTASDTKATIATTLATAALPLRSVTDTNARTEMSGTHAR